MVFMQFPSVLTEEEETLKQIFAKLKRKKKQLQNYKSQQQQQEKETKTTTKTKPAPTTSIGKADKATEQAKKLVQSGAIKVTEQKEKSGFKRSKNLEKKLKDQDKPPSAVGFQPFQSYAVDDENDKSPPSKRMKGLGESFVSAGYNRSNFNRESHLERDGDRERRDPPKRGKTIFVHGVGVTEDMLHKAFASFGEIINISMEPERHNAFITFDTLEAAEQAISEVNGSMINNTQLRVQMARRQPNFDNVVDSSASSSSSWASIAANNSQKGSGGPHRDKRRMVTYDADGIF